MGLRTARYKKGNQMTPQELERSGYTLKSYGGTTKFPEYSAPDQPTGRVFQYYEKGVEVYALVISEPSENVGR